MRAWLVAAVLFGSTAAHATVDLIEIAPGVLVHLGAQEDFTEENAGDIANLGAVIGNEKVAVIDTGGSKIVGDALLVSIRRHTDLPIAFVINTHHHPDHVLGNIAFSNENAAFVGHARLPGALADRGPHYIDRMQDLLGDSAVGSEVILPTLLIEDEQTLDLGGRILHLKAWSTGHTTSDLTVLDEQTGTLFMGDLLFIHRLPVVDGSLSGWIGHKEVLENIEVQQVVPGHGPVSDDWPSAMTAQFDYLVELRDAVRAALAANTPLSTATETVRPAQTDDWLLNADNHERNVVTSYTELEWE